MPIVTCRPVRFHDVFAPNYAHRARATPAKRGEGNKASASYALESATSAERRAAMSWAQRLKRVFNIGIETCGGRVKTIACIPALTTVSGTAPSQLVRGSLRIRRTAHMQDPRLRYRRDGRVAVGR